MAPKPPPLDAVPIFRFSTDAFLQRERVAAWREIFGRTVVNLDIEPLNPDGFHAEATSAYSWLNAGHARRSYGRHCRTARPCRHPDDGKALCAPATSWFMAGWVSVSLVRSCVSPQHEPASARAHRRRSRISDLLSVSCERRAGFAVRGAKALCP